METIAKALSSPSKELFSDWSDELLDGFIKSLIEQLKLISNVAFSRDDLHTIMLSQSRFLRKQSKIELIDLLQDRLISARNFNIKVSIDQVELVKYGIFQVSINNGTNN